MAMQLLKRKVTLGQRLGGEEAEAKKANVDSIQQARKAVACIVLQRLHVCSYVPLQQIEILQVQMICDQENYAIKLFGYQNESLIPVRLTIARSFKDLVSG